MRRAEYANPHDERVVSKTCLGCRIEKTIDAFAWRKRERCYHSRCHDCLNAYRRARYRSRAGAVPHPRLWTSAEDARLRESILAGMTLAETALALGRTEASVINRRKKLRAPRFRNRRSVKRKRAASRAWPPKRVEALKALRDEGCSYSACADRMGLSRGAVATAIRRFFPKVTP